MCLYGRYICERIICGAIWEIGGNDGSPPPRVTQSKTKESATVFPLISPLLGIITKIYRVLQNTDVFLAGQNSSIGHPV